jgi:hypothetical protein
MTGNGQMPKRSEWRDDDEFVKIAAKLWPEDMDLATRGGYDRGAVQRMRFRWQGMNAKENLKRL